MPSRRANRMIRSIACHKCYMRLIVASASFVRVPSTKGKPEGFCVKANPETRNLCAIRLGNVTKPSLPFRHEGCQATARNRPGRARVQDRLGPGGHIRRFSIRLSFEFGRHTEIEKIHTMEEPRKFTDETTDCRRFNHIEFLRHPRTQPGSLRTYELHSAQHACN